MTMFAVFNFLHLIVIFLGQIGTIWCPTEEKIHSVTIFYGYAGGTRLTISTSTTECATQFLPVFGDTFFHIFCQRRRMILKSKPLIKFFLSLDAPDGLHMGILCHKGKRGGGIGNETA